MTDPTPTPAADLATDLLRSEGWAAGPAVNPLRAEIRSGENFLIAAATNLPDLFIGALVIEWGYEVPREKSDEFHAWLSANERSLAAEAPAGVHYRGTYGVFAQSSQALGAYRTIWAFDTLPAMEALAQEAAGNGSFGQRLRELTAFRDESIGASRSQQIYQVAAASKRS